MDPIIICGPTSCGKSGVAFQLAKKINGEIIHSDKFYLYPPKYFSVGTGLNDDVELMRGLGLKGHFYGILSPRQHRPEPREYRRWVECLIPSIVRRGKKVIIQGCAVSYNYELIRTGMKTFAVHPPLRNGALEERIVARVRAMFADGLVEETERALRLNLGDCYVMRKGDIYIPTVKLLRGG